MNLDLFLEYLNNDEIPPESPDCGTPGGHNYWGEDFRDGLRGRDEAIKLGMWAIVCQSWTTLLADWIGNRTILEVMAGRGWLAKALAEAGVDILATDDFSWKNGGCPPVYPVQKLEAIQAISENRNRDLLLMSWPPYDTPDAIETLRMWGPGKPVIYIGEGYGGCNGDNEFHNQFQPYRPQPDISIPSWPGIHDYLTIGELRP